MNGAKLSKEVTKRGREIAACEVLIDTGKELKPIAIVEYDEKRKRLVIVPESSNPVLGSKPKKGKK